MLPGYRRLEKYEDSFPVDVIAELVRSRATLRLVFGRAAYAASFPLQDGGTV